MSGSGGDGGAPEVHGGEFSQQFLRNPPQEPASQNTSNNPAVAPSVSLSPSMYQNNTHNHHLPYNPPPPHLHFAPHNFFLQTPNPNLITASLPHPGLDQNQYSHNANSVGAANSKPISAHKQQVKSESGYLDIRNTAGVSNSRLGNKIPYGLDIEFQKSLNLNWNNGPGGNSRLGPTPGRRPPPGISSNATSVGNRSGGFEQNVSKGKSKTRELNGKNVNTVNKYEKERGMGRGVPGERRFSHQLDKPALTAHSANASDFQESQMGLHREVKVDQMRSNDDRIKSELVDSEGIVEALVLEVESTDKKKQKVTRDKDYRADKRGRWILNQQMRILKRRIECRSDIYRLNIPLREIYESLIPSEEEKAKQKLLLALLKKHVNKEWPEGRLYLYGSCDNLFGFKKSDIDVCLEIDDTDVNKSEVLLKLASILQSDNLQNVQALTRARVPIVKLMDPASGISCDICVNNLLAVINTKLLRDYALIDGRLRQLAFIIKHWAKSRGVNETYQGTLSSYAYVLMCINFLQQRNPAILPCLQGMERTYAVTVDNTECAYFDHVDKLIGFGSQNIESIAKLVWEFFNYWAYYHDYTSRVISVRTGSTLNKREKDWTRRVGNDRHLICIEDPFEISHDLGRVVDKYSLRVLREEFERAAKIMQDDPDPWVTLFEPYVPS